MRSANCSGSRQDRFALCAIDARPVVNLALALVNRLTPQIQVFFVGTPFVVAGGLMLLYFTIKSAIDAFLIGFGAWLHTGKNLTLTEDGV